MLKGRKKTQPKKTRTFKPAGLRYFQNGADRGHGSKQSRHRKNKKTQHPPGKPRLRLATAAERRLAGELRRLNHAGRSVRFTQQPTGDPTRIYRTNPC